MMQDIRVALRSLGKSPGFSAVVILTLALGVGAITAVFSVVNGALLAALPYRAPERLVRLQGTWAEGATVIPSQSSYADLRDFERQSELFEAFGLYSGDPQFFVLKRGDTSQQVTGEFVSASYFPTLGIRAAEGRLFRPEEDQPPAGSRVALLSHDAFLSRFGGDRSILDSTVLVSDDDYQIIGVLPEGFRGITDNADLFLPVTTAVTIFGKGSIEDRSNRWLTAVARLKSGASVERATAEMEIVTQRLAQSYPDTNEKAGVSVVSLIEALQGSLRRGLVTLLIAAAFVLLIGCVNIANLLLTRAMARQGEISIRAALGASRRQLIRQVLTESLVLAACGCAAGLLLALWATRLLVNASGVTFRSGVEIGLDPLVVAAAVVASLLAGFGFGLLPALSGSRVELTEILKEGGKASASFGRQRLQSALVVAEVALALLLFVSAGLMIRSFVNLQQLDLGFRPSGVLTLRVDVKGDRYAGQQQQVDLAQQWLTQLASVAGVRSVALSSPDLPSDDYIGIYTSLEEREDVAVNDQVALELHRVSPDYFSTLGIPILQGQPVAASDLITSRRVAVVSQEVERRYWGTGTGLRRRLKLGERDALLPWFNVVGIAGPVLHAGLKDDDRPGLDLYVPMLQLGFGPTGLVNFLVRAEDGVSAADLAGQVRAEIQTVARDLPVFDVATIEQRLERQVTGDRFLVLLMSLFALIALLLAAVGIYGVISYAVTQRTKEIGVRIALGATGGDVLRLIVRRGVLLALAGVGVGLLASLALTRLLRGLLYGIGTLDPLTLAGTALFLVAVASAASYLPARRAVRIEPTVTLRAD
jgi:predicted permease